MRKGFKRFLFDRIYYPGISTFNEPQRIAHQRTRQISWETKSLQPLRSPCLYESFARSFHASSVRASTRDVVFIAGLVLNLTSDASVTRSPLEWRDVIDLVGFKIWPSDCHYQPECVLYYSSLLMWLLDLKWKYPVCGCCRSVDNQKVFLDTCALPKLASCHCS